MAEVRSEFARGHPPRTSAPPSPTLSPANQTDVVDGYQVPVDPMDQLQCDGCQ